MNKVLMTLGIASLLAVPVGFASSFATDTVVTGHTIFVDASGFDPDIALIAGLASSKVVWFNGVIVINRFDSGYIYAVEEGDCDPTEVDAADYALVDQDLAFKDPNQVFHVVTHYTYECAGEDFPLNPIIPGLEDITGNHTNHVWVTPTHNRTLDLTAAGNYNFATGVDISLFNGPNWIDEDAHTGNATSHDGTGGDTTQEIRDGDSYNAASNQHTFGETDGLHSHNTGEVDLYFLRTDLGGSSAACVTTTCSDRQAGDIPTGTGAP